MSLVLLVLTVCITWGKKEIVEHAAATYPMMVNKSSCIDKMIYHLIYSFEKQEVCMSHNILTEIGGLGTVEEVRLSSCLWKII